MLKKSFLKKWTINNVEGIENVKKIQNERDEITSKISIESYERKWSE